MTLSVPEAQPLGLPQFDDVVDYIKAQQKQTVHGLLRAADESGRVLIQPRCGVGAQQTMKDLLIQLEQEAMPDVLTLTIDSHTRLLRFDTACNVLAADPRQLNGYPLVAHGWKLAREIDMAVQAPIEIRHGSPDPRILFDVALAAGFTSFEGGGICYNLPYCKDVSISHSLACWRHVDRVCGALADQGIIVDRELFGTLTGVLIPPSVSLAMTLIEALLSAREGVRCLSIAYCQSGHLIQDVAALRAVRVLASRHLPPGVEVYPVFHEFMGAFPAKRHNADALIFFGALTAARGRATKLINKTYDEAHGIPSAQANISGIWTARMATSRLFDTVVLPEDEIAEECRAICAEVEDIVAPVLSASDPYEATVRGFACGKLDIPFSANRHAQSRVLPMRDQTGAIRYNSFGGLPVGQEAQRRNHALLHGILHKTDFDPFTKLQSDISHFVRLDEAVEIDGQTNPVWSLSGPHPYRAR